MATSACASVSGRASSLTAISGPMPFGSPSSTANRGRRELLDTDIGRLDELAEAIELVPIHPGELVDRQGARLSAEALEPRLHVRQCQCALQLGMQLLDNRLRRSAGDEETVPRRHFRAWI